MAGLLLQVYGRLAEGETLEANGTEWEAKASLQWQALMPGGRWVDVGEAGALTYTIPAGAEGVSYRLAAVFEGQTWYSDVTPAVVADHNNHSAPVITGWDNYLVTFPTGVPVVMDGVFQGVAFSDADNGHYKGGSLLVSNTNSIAAGGDGQDMLGIRPIADNTTFLVYDGTNGNIWWSVDWDRSRVVAQVDPLLDGNGTDLLITFTQYATQDVINVIIDRLFFETDDETPVEGRFLTLRITDPDDASVQVGRWVAVDATPEDYVIEPPFNPGVLVGYPPPETP